MSAKFQVGCFESNCYTNQNRYQTLRNYRTLYVSLETSASIQVVILCLNLNKNKYGKYAHQLNPCITNII
jgi:hypothetical protein